MKTIAFIFLYIITNLCYSVNSQETTSQKQCAAIGEYCQNHWDCCSKSCLSFSYKCVRNYQNEKDQVVVTSGSAPNLGNRFGSSQNMGVPQLGVPFVYYPPTPIYSNRPQIVNSVDDLINLLSGTFNQAPQTQVRPENQLFVDTVNRGNIEPEPVQQSLQPMPNVQCYSIGTHCKNSPDCCSLSCQYSVCQTGYNITNGPELSHTNGKCFKIGERCYRHTECCTGRCHSFLHQCVT